ncbi:MAG TPA: FkbM family methyltransferase [Longimicrobiaceae bacterium]|nr:FkbM family methyltransferase [Longimicrobiaceae bacterium]
MVTLRSLRSAIRHRLLLTTVADLVDDRHEMLWEMAQVARKHGDLELVDALCASLLRSDPHFWFARELPKHARGWYAQNGQDAVIERFFESRPPRTRRFVEVGAFDGVHYSNVRRLHERHGWSGLCIEPVVKNYKKLCQSYAGTDVHCVNAAVTAGAGMIPLHVSSYPHLPEWGSDVASVHPEERERWSGFEPEWHVEQVRAVGLTELLGERGVVDFDLLSIDTEGCDLAVLRTLDFTRYRPALVVVEFGSDREAIVDHLDRAGYELVQDDGQDGFFAERV